MAVVVGASLALWGSARDDIYNLKSLVPLWATMDCCQAVWQCTDEVDLRPQHHRHVDGNMRFSTFYKGSTPRSKMLHAF